MKEQIIDFIKTLFSSLLIVAILYFFIAIPVRVSGSSMYPNLENGEFGFAGKFTLLGDIDRYDVVVIESDKTDNKKIVKRVIGLPNETLKFEGKNIYVDGKLLDDPYAYYGEYEDLLYDGEISLGEDEYFVLGDNRNVSKDSRAYEEPGFSKDEIISKDILILFPFNKIGIE